MRSATLHKLIFLVFFLAGAGCETDMPFKPLPPSGLATFRLAAEKITRSRATIRIHFTDTVSLRQAHGFSLRRNGQLVVALPSLERDTLLTDTLLFRGQTYLYKGYRFKGAKAVDSSRTITVSTIDSASIGLRIDHAGINESGVVISLKDFNAPRGFLLKRDGLTISQGSVWGSDTVLADNGLHAARTYNYAVYRVSESGLPVDSGQLNLTTIDTTSHNFSFQIDTLGQLTSRARDVAVLSDNSIWVAGTFNFFDADSSLSLQYGLARWDGTSWTFQKVPFTSSCIHGYSPPDTFPEPVDAIYAIAPNDIWLTDGNYGFTHWDGNKFTPTCTPQLGWGFIQKMWASAHGDLYGIGLFGTILHFDGTTWEKMESHTTSTLTDIWGSPDGRVIWACGYRDFEPTVLLRCRNGTWENLYSDENNLFTYTPDSLSGGVSSVWTNSSTEVYALTWFDLYKLPVETHGRGRAIWGGDNAFYTWAVTRVRGSAINNIFTVSDNGNMWHYNGSTWASFNAIVNPRDALVSVDVTPSTVAAVGDRYYDGIHYYGVVYIGRR